MADARRWEFWMDTGGTFTDCVARDPAGDWHRLKVLSSGALRGRLARIESARRVVLESVPAAHDGLFAGYSLTLIHSGIAATIVGWDAASLCAELDRDLPVAAGDLVDLSAREEAPVLAMRLLTRTPLRDRIPPAALRLATTRATNALLEGRGAPVAFFVTAGFGDLLRIRDQRRPDLFAIRVEKPPPLHGPVVEVRGRLAADGSELQPVDVDAVRVEARRLRGEGFTAAAVALLHSTRQPAHEQAVAHALREAGFSHVSVSSELARAIKLLPRAETAVVDATLAPIMEQYLDGVAAAVDPRHFLVMTSAGGLVRGADYRPKDSLLSGPAGGVAGAAAVAARAGFSRIITFDMGGTSTDVARVDGDFEYQSGHAVGPARILAPALRVESVAAGGGSVCRFDGVALVVGPESAGARPGPACYGAGGPLTLTDVNLLAGRLDPARFGIPVFPAAAEAALQEVIDAIAAARGGPPARGEILRGFLEIADERMADAIRRISVREGYDPAEYALVAFGGAGGLHACAVAARLGIRSVLYPADSGLLSAYGLGRATEERILTRQVLRPLGEAAAGLPGLVAELESEGRIQLEAGGAAGPLERRRAEVELRLSGQDSGLMVEAGPAGTLVERYLEAYRTRFGYVPLDRVVEVVAVRVVVSTRPDELAPETFGPASSDVPCADRAISRAALQVGDCFRGPGLVQDAFSTLFVPENWTARVGSVGSLLLEAGERTRTDDESGAEVVALELFANRFRALVDDMGQLLQRCALSVNVKERLDFSCALLDSSGELVAHAPHVPVHLGALGLCVRRVAEALDLREGDVVITNHPAFGGAHLPDVTLVAPVFAGGALLGYVANRAHHAEIGGIRPGSMPPDARRLIDEGVVLPPIHLVRSGVADWQGLEARLRGGPHPSRRVDENIADLHAQLASVRLGAAALERLATAHGLSCIQHYMRRIQDRAEAALAAALDARGTFEAEASDALDDGTPIAVRLHYLSGRLLVDFSGSGGVHPGNLNATPAIVRSALIYVLRLLAGRDLPLNEGLMRRVDLVLPTGLLSPEFGDDPAACPAVVGGNVETSQRVVDVLVRALGLAASSQGTMNNVIFGNARVSYYETVGGGTGAGEGFHGADGVHSHMTNTAITDPEILETRLPVRLERFALRHGSGGVGRWRGGDGLERVMTFLEPVEISLLTQRRIIGAPGLHGGGAGVPGEQWLERAGGGRVALGAIAGIVAQCGDRLRISTPGGGAWGT